MRSWPHLLAALATSVGCAVVLAVAYGSAIEIPAGVGLVIALALLARTALRLAGNPAQPEGDRSTPHA